MISFEKLAHIGIRVADFERSVAFYQRFGFVTMREDRQEHVVVVRHPSGLELNLLDSATSDNESRNILMDEESRYPGLTHIALQVRDIAVAEQDIRAGGMAITEGPVRFGDGSSSIFFRDPDRNVIELSQPSRETQQKNDFLSRLAVEMEQ